MSPPFPTSGAARPTVFPGRARVCPLRGLALFIQEETDVMDLSKIPAGVAPPDDINVIVEIPQGGYPVKYEMDKASGALFVDRFLHAAMTYPANYGFIPDTLSADGDPCDALVICQQPVATGSVIRSRPIGALLMEDEHGKDEKILAVPVDRLHPYYSQVRSHEDLPRILLDQIAHFFQHYKDLEKGKWVEITRWVGADAARNLIMDAVKAAQETHHG